MRKPIWVLGWSLFGVACAGNTPAPASSAQAAQAEAPPARSKTLDDAMRDHFADATAARDGVIAGHLEFVRAPLLRLANRKEGEDTPSDWLSWIADMQAAAKRGSEAASIAEAAGSVAALGANCGECHRTTRGGVRHAAETGGYEPHGAKGLAEKMARHQYAADELWLGLTGPSHTDWTQGAAALMNIQVPALVDLHGDPATQDRTAGGEGELEGSATYTEPAPLGPSAANAIDLDAALRELRELGQAADQAKNPSEKQEIFAKVIVRCGSCHAKLGIQLL
jgi:hypothetical protein